MSKMSKNFGGTRTITLGKANGYATIQNIIKSRATACQVREEAPINQSREASPSIKKLI